MFNQTMFNRTLELNQTTLLRQEILCDVNNIFAQEARAFSYFTGNFLPESMIQIGITLQSFFITRWVLHLIEGFVMVTPHFPLFLQVGAAIGTLYFVRNAFSGEKCQFKEGESEHFNLSILDSKNQLAQNPSKEECEQIVDKVSNLTKQYVQESRGCGQKLAKVSSKNKECGRKLEENEKALDYTEKALDYTEKALDYTEKILDNTKKILNNTEKALNYTTIAAEIFFNDIVNICTENSEIEYCSKLPSDIWKCTDFGDLEGESCQINSEKLLSSLLPSEFDGFFIPEVIMFPDGEEM